MRFHGAVVLVAVVAGVVSADIIYPPLPKGIKRVSVECEVLLAKEVTGYVFVRAMTDESQPQPEIRRRRGLPDPSEPKPKFCYTRVEFSETKPVNVSPGRFLIHPFLYAIPREVAKEYKTDEDLCAAVASGRIEKAVGFGVSHSADVSDKVKGDKVTWTYTITAIDAKNGFTTTIMGEGYEPPAKPREEKNEPKKPLALSEPSYLIGGLAAALTVTFGGLWLVRRNGPKMKA